MEITRAFSESNPPLCGWQYYKYCEKKNEPQFMEIYVDGVKRATIYPEMKGIKQALKLLIKNK